MGTWLVVTTISLRTGSIAGEPQSLPPSVDGLSTDPCSDGGVYSPSLRSALSAARHLPRSQKVNHQASAGPSDIEASGSGSVGIGCVGLNFSPATAPACGAGRSST
jgi:hypothetical protein